MRESPDFQVRLFGELTLFNLEGTRKVPRWTNKVREEDGVGP